jgi:hypothetical protein
MRVVDTLSAFAFALVAFCCVVVLTTRTLAVDFWREACRIWR